MFYFTLITRRFLEVFITEGVLSAIFAALFNFGILESTRDNVTAVIIITLVIFFALQTWMLRNCYYGIADNQDYLVINLSANAIFAIVNGVMYALFSRELYTYFFGIFKITHLLSNTGTVFSAALMHFILMLIVFAAPFGAKLKRTSRRPTANKKEPNNDFVMKT